MLEGLEKVLEIISKEKQFAENVNPVMVLGMVQIENLVKEEIEYIKNK